MNFLKNKEIFKNGDFFILLPNELEIVSWKLNMEINVYDILFVEEQKNIVLNNTTNYAKNLKSSNCFLWGARGMGKSSLIKCSVKEINEKLNNKLKLIELLNQSIRYLPEIIYFLKDIKFNFIIFIDDITFDDSPSDFKLFKSILEGSMLGEVSNVKFYVTSNLRHLTTYNTNQENLDNIAQKEIYTNLVSLSDRFGCKVGFFENSQKNYLDIINHYAEIEKISLTPDLQKKSLEWSIQKGNFSGRTAYQFVVNLKNFKSYDK